MINANELRIGNLVSYNGARSHGEVGTVSITELRWQQANTWQDMGASGGMYYEEIEPIPLTVEWLIKFGFENYGELYKKIKLTGGYLTIRNDSPTYAEVAHEGERSCIAPCEYVHQLQNLYFALTGKELEIK